MATTQTLFSASTPITTPDEMESQFDEHFNNYIAPWIEKLLDEIIYRPWRRTEYEEEVFLRGSSLLDENISTNQQSHTQFDEEQDLIDLSSDDGNDVDTSNVQLAQRQPIDPAILAFVPSSVEYRTSSLTTSSTFALHSTSQYPTPPSTLLTTPTLNPFAMAFTPRSRVPVWTSHNHRYWGELKRECPMVFNDGGKRRDQFLRFPCDDPNARNGEFVILVVDLLQKLYNPLLPHLRRPNTTPKPVFPPTVTSESTQNVEFTVTANIFHQIINDVGHDWRALFLNVWDIIAPREGEENWEICEGCNPELFGKKRGMGEERVVEKKEFDRGRISDREWDAAVQKSRLNEVLVLHR